MTRISKWSIALMFTIFGALGITISLHAASDDSNHHLGVISQPELFSKYDVFKQGYDDYQPQTEQLSQMQSLAGKDVLVMFGTWCHDSEREVPRFLKLLSESQVNLNSLTLVALDFDKNDPLGISDTYDLRYTPTFVVLEDREEVARVIERPKHNDLAKDIEQQLNK